MEGLKVGFDTEAGFVHAVDGVDLSIGAGQTLGLVGESGCGKSVTAASILRLIPSPPGRIHAGSIWFQGQDLRTLSPRELQGLRGAEISMIFQDPMTALNPVFTVERQLTEILRVRSGMKRDEARGRALEMLRRVGMPDSETRLSAYPHELSGGMKQRVMIAMALLESPQLLIADEPTTALDVTVQAQILDLIRTLQAETGAAVLVITHDMGVVAELCDHVAVMYAGRIVEQGPVARIFRQSTHPYSRGLLGSMPGRGKGNRKMELPTIEGVVPSLLSPPPGCRFAERCPVRKARSAGEQERCAQEDPRPTPLSEGDGWVACHFPVMEAPR
jgi:oligopeptide/dipeptide ABC transporter ATP-binding protein